MKTIVKSSVYLSVFFSVSVYAQPVVTTNITTDGTVGGPGNFGVSHSMSMTGHSVTIPQDYGTPAGGNLFHSFRTFNIGAGDTATFTSIDSFKNVISRVTGGHSDIYGTLQSSIPNANFYFINPAGVTFGAGANVDVPTAFHVSTANQINFADGNIYSATNPSASTLTIADPTSFGFVNPSPASIQINGSQLNPSYENHKTGQTVDLVAGSITIKDNGKLSAPAGEIRLVAVKGNEDVSLVRDSNGFLPLPTQTPTSLNGGTVSVNDSTITTQGNSSGRLALWGGDATFNKSTFNANNDGDLNASAGKGIDIKALTLNVLHNSSVNSSDLAAGKAGNLNITAGTLNLLDNSFISTDVQGSADGSNLTVNADTVMIDSLWRPKFPYGETYPLPPGFLGTGISSDVYGAGNGGTVTVNANTLEMHSAVWISSCGCGSGNGGNVIVTAKNITVNGENNFYTTFISSQANGTRGNAGSVYVKADSLNLVNAGTIQGNSYGPDNPYATFKVNGGNASNITVEGSHIKIDSQGSPWWTGIVSDLVFGSTGQAGVVKVNTNTLEVLHDGFISSASLNGDGGLIPVPTNSNGNPGDVIINAQQSIYVNHGKIRTSTSGTGLGGTIQVYSPLVTLDNGAEITATSSTASYSGNIKINASILNLFNDSKISVANTGSGHAGTINLNIDNTLTAQQGSLISSSISGAGDAGDITITSPSISIDNANISAVAEAGSSGNAGKITLTGNSLTVKNEGEISSSTLSTGKAGNVEINVKNTQVGGEGNYAAITSTSGSETSAVTNAGDAGLVTINGDSLTVLNGGQVSSSTLSSGKAGDVNINVSKTLVNGQGDYAAIISTSGTETSTEIANAGTAGTVTINGDSLTVLNGGQVSSSTLSSGDAGNVKINVSKTLVDGKGNYASITSTSGTETKTPANAGKGGTVTINGDRLKVINGGQVSSSTLTSGDAGNVEINVKNTLVDGQGEYAAITSTSGTETKKVSNAGDAGTVNITGKSLTVLNGGGIDDSTFTSGKAGDVTITENTLTINGGSDFLSTGIASDANPNSSGDAGHVTVHAGTLDILNGGSISSDTYAAGNAGNVIVTANALNIDGVSYQTFTGISSDTHENATGNAGNVTVTADAMKLDAGFVSSDTYASGKAGIVTVNAGTLDINNDAAISSASIGENSSGKTGDVTVTASKSLHLADGSISIENDAKAKNPAAIIPGLIKVSAPDIDLKNSEITTAANGNVDAGNININFSHWLTMDPSFISTTANTGNGGTITINGGALIYLQDSGFLTSVSGATSNGGNINVSADALVMNTGVIQANAVGGTGGDINLNLKTLIPSQNSLILGGEWVLWQPFIAGFNVIQAASETGVNGTVNMASPQLNISGSISGLNTKALVVPLTDREICANSINPSSTLVRGGKGGIPVSEAKAGFIPSASGVSIAPEKNSLNAKLLNANAVKQATSYPCAAVSSR